MLRTIPLLSLLVLAPWHAILAKEDAPLASLEEALWEGTLVLKVQGPIFSQILENELDEAGNPSGFVKEKGSMNVDYTLTLRFQVNALGDFTLAADELGKARQQLDSEYWHHFQEEVLVDKGVKMKQRVKVSEILTWQHVFDSHTSFDQDSIPSGSLQLLPSGRMDKKGALTIKGEFKTQLRGEGQLIEKKERQPPKPGEEKVYRSRASSADWGLSLKFEVNIQLRKEPVSGSFEVSLEALDPFTMSKRKRKSSDVYNNNTSATGSFSLTPLFGKK